MSPWTTSDPRLRIVLIVFSFSSFLSGFHWHNLVCIFLVSLYYFFMIQDLVLLEYIQVLVLFPFPLHFAIIHMPIHIWSQLLRWVVIQNDPHCWKDGVVGGTQTKCHLLLCNSYTKKA